MLILFGQGQAGHDLGAAAVHLQRPDGGGEHRDVGFQAAVAALDVPEFLKADVGAETALGDVVVKQLQTDPVGDDGGLAHGDVGKRSGMDHAGLILRRHHQGRVDGVAHPGGHGAADFQIAGGDRFACFVKGHRDVVQPFAQVGQIADDGQNGHQLGADGDPELGLHDHAVQPAAHTDNDISQGLGTEVHDPAHLHPGGVDVEPAHTGQARKLFIVVVALVLHSGGQGDHGQVVGVHDVVDVAGQTHGELGHGNDQ